MIATPLGVRDVVAAHLGFVLFRLATTCAVFLLVLAPFGVFASVVGRRCWRSLAQLLVGLAFAALVYGFTARLHAERGRSR